MENNFHNEDLEKFLKKNADQYRMYPSEKVWKGIYSSLHTRRRWYIIGSFAAILLAVSSIGIYLSLNRTSAPEVSIVNTKVASTETIQNNKEVALQDLNSDLPANNNPINSVFNHSPNLPDNIPSTTPVLNSVSLVNQKSLMMDNRIAPRGTETIDETNTFSIPDNSTVKEENANTQENKTQKPATKEDLMKAAMALESQNAPVYKTTKKGNRLTAQFFITPSFSYRKLSENKSFLANSSNSQLSYTQFMDVNNLVKHKPALGLEFGVEGQYKFTNLITATTGFQFNINRYDIKAFYHPTEYATIALNSRSYGTNSLQTLSNYRNFGAYSPNWIENFYFQLSVPVGVKLTLLRDDKFEWGVTGNIQPTYTIGDKAYLITTDYKNYVKVPNLMRRWNLNTGIGAFVSTNTGVVKWQVGPQLRYQHYSSFEAIYPVKENLFNVGLRIGATIDKR